MYDTTNLPANLQEADVIVVGSGAGGGTMAAQLVKAGFSVLWVEKGGYYRSDTFRRWSESEAAKKSFDRSGLMASNDGSLLIYLTNIYLTNYT